MIFNLPKPIGKYTVGIKHTSFVYLYNGENREIPMYVYYPADSTEEKTSYPYGNKEIYSEYPNAEELAATVTHCFENVAVSNDQKEFPLVVFSVGYGCFTMFNTVLCSDIASSGFIVASIGHPGDGTICFPSGKIEQMAPEHFKEMMNEERNKILEGFIPRFDEIGDGVETIKLGKDFFENQPFFNSRVDIWVADKSATIDFFEGQNEDENSIFYKKINFKTGVSVGGHSFGGSSAVDATRKDKRVVCGVNIDGGNFGYNYAEDIKKPFLTIGNPHIWGMLMGYTVANTADSFFVGVLDGDHMGFTDFIYFDQNDRVGTRNKDDYRMLISDYYISFIKTYQTKAHETFHRLNYKNTKYYEKSRIE